MSQPKGRGFTLVELLVVLAMIGIFAAMSVASLKAALFGARATATLADLVVLRNAVQMLGADCGSLPRWTSTADPGLAYKATWAANCWRGPYLDRWLSVAPLRGGFQYVGQRNAQPLLRTHSLDRASAQRLAAEIQQHLGAGALAALRRSGTTWQVDLLLRDAPRVQ